jgi:hypothetical protein
MDPQIYRRELTHGRYSTENIIVNRAFLLSCHFAQYCRQHPLVVFLIRAISGRHVYLRSHVHYECATGPIPRGIAAAARRYCSASSIMGRDQSAVSCWSFKRSRYSLVYFGSAAISAAADGSAHLARQIIIIRDLDVSIITLWLFASSLDFWTSSFGIALAKPI